jgi:hypothetical protein
MKKLILLGAGNSIKEGLEKDLWNKIKHIEKWSLNSMFKIMPYLPDREIWVDKKFFEQTVVELQQLSLKGVKMITRNNTRYAELDSIIQYEGTREILKWNKENKVLFMGQMGLTGIFALSLAIIEGYEEIYLLGYDFGNTSIKDKQTHIYQDKLKALRIYSTGSGNPEVYRNDKDQVKNEVEDFNVYLHEKAKIYNVSLNSNIKIFPRISYDEFFSKII